MLPTEPGPQAGQNRIFEGIGPLSQSWFDIFDRLLLSVSRQEVGGLHSTTQPDGVCVCVCVSDGGSSRVTLQAGSLA